MGQMLLVSRQASALGIIALGQAVVVLVGGIDLSVGSVAVSYTHLDVYKRQETHCPTARNST